MIKKKNIKKTIAAIITGILISCSLAVNMPVMAEEVTEAEYITTEEASTEYIEEEEATVEAEFAEQDEADSTVKELSEDTEKEASDTEYELTGYIVETPWYEPDSDSDVSLYGASLTEESVYKTLLSFMSVYPEGMEWTNANSYAPYYHYTASGRRITYTGFGCAGFTFHLSNGAFGNLPDREHYDWNNIRVGDIIRVNDDTHSVIVLKVDGDKITVAEGNYNSTIHWGRVISRRSLAGGEGTYIWTRWPEMSLNSPSIYCSSDFPSITAGMTVNKSFADCDVEYRWVACDESKPEEWFEISGWKNNYEWVSWKPDKSGNYILKCYARIVGNEEESEVSAVTGVGYHSDIKGICQMPYDGPGGGYLIGIESYDNPNQSYSYEMLILDCTLYAKGLPAWTYTTGKCKVSEGNALWTVWQPEYGYYWTLFRVFDKNGNMVDEECFGFQNIY